MAGHDIDAFLFATLTHTLDLRDGSSQRRRRATALFENQGPTYGRIATGIRRAFVARQDRESKVTNLGRRDLLSNLPWPDVRIPFPISVELPVR
jgi:hypothetical protein